MELINETPSEYLNTSAKQIKHKHKISYLKKYIKNSEILSSSNFARYSDIVYSEIILKKDCEVNSDNVFVIYEDNEFLMAKLVCSRIIHTFIYIYIN